MKQLRQGGMLKIVWLCALALTVLTVVTTPFAMSKYMAQGQGAAKARIAAWAVVWDDVKNTHAFGGTYVNPGSITLPYTVDITNNSEVLIRGYFQPMMVGPGADPSADANRPTTYPLGAYSYTGARTPMRISTGTTAATRLELSSITMMQVGIGARVNNVACTFAGDPIKALKTYTGLGPGANTAVSKVDYRWEAYRVNMDVAAVQVD